MMTTPPAGRVAPRARPPLPAPDCTVCTYCHPQPLQYNVLAKSGEQVGKHVTGTNYDRSMKPVRAYDANWNVLDQVIMGRSGQLGQLGQTGMWWTRYLIRRLYSGCVGTHGPEGIGYRYTRSRGPSGRGALPPQWMHACGHVECCRVHGGVCAPAPAYTYTGLYTGYLMPPDDHCTIVT